ncbi:MAG: thermonuclease family protein [Candidatus Aenigmatarchaeota archaeon]
MKLDSELLVHIFIICTILAGGFLLSLRLSSLDYKSMERAIVTKVIDGDTIIVEGGKNVRLLGIDADEKGYPCYDDAKKRLEELILDKEVILERYSENKDMYDRYLRYVFFNGTNINLKMVREGLAIARFSDEIEYKEEIQRAEKKAIDNNIGCKWSEEDKWRKNGNNFTDPCEAEKFKNKEITVGGKVSDSYISQNNNVFLNFGGEYPNHCFTAVIFSHSLDKFNINFDKVKGSKVKVSGEVEMFKDKPEIIIENRAQIEMID